MGMDPRLNAHRQEEHKSDVAQLRRKLRDYGPRPCIEHDGRLHSYTHLVEELDRWRARFKELDLPHGSIVAIRADYSLAAIGALLGILACDIIVALIPHDRDPSHYLREAHAMISLELDGDGEYQCCLLDEPNGHPPIDANDPPIEARVLLFSSNEAGQPRAALESLERFLDTQDKPTRPTGTPAVTPFDQIDGLEALFDTLANGGTLRLRPHPDSAEGRNVAQR